MLGGEIIVKKLSKSTLKYLAYSCFAGTLWIASRDQHGLTGPRNDVRGEYFKTQKLTFVAYPHASHCKKGYQTS